MVLEFANGVVNAQIGDLFRCTGKNAHACDSRVTAATQVIWRIADLIHLDEFDICATPVSNAEIIDPCLHPCSELPIDNEGYYFPASALEYIGHQNDHAPICYYCGKSHEGAIEVDGRYICPTCYESHTFVCIECGAIHDTRRRMRGINLCRPCYDSSNGKYRRAADDDKVYLASELIRSVWDRSLYVTKKFAESNWIKCDECGKYETPLHISKVNGKNYCYECVRDCNYCGRPHLVSDMTEVDGAYYCKRCSEHHLVKCSDCGKMVPDIKIFKTTDSKEPLCSSCYNRRKCSICGNVHSDTTGYEMDVAYYDSEFKRTGNICPTCLAHIVNKCADCGVYVICTNSDLAPDNKFYCPEHFKDHFIVCTRCGKMRPKTEKFYGEDEYALCSVCYEKEEHGTKGGLSGSDTYYSAPEGLCAYHHKPTPIFYPNKNSGSLFYGIELEVDDGYEFEGAIDVGNELFGITYAKHDGSLGDDGIEFVSHPATIDWFMEHKDNWAKGMKELRNEFEYSSHSAGTCGLHIHASSFPLLYETESGIEKLLYFQDKYWDELLKFSRRNGSQVENWANRISTGSVSAPDREKLSCLKDSKKKTRNGARYQCINLQNEHTVEFRIFRGTLNIDTFIATVQFVANLCELACEKTFDEFKNLTWEDVINYHDYAELMKYWKSRALSLEKRVEYDRDCGEIHEVRNSNDDTAEAA